MLYEEDYFVNLHSIDKVDPSLLLSDHRYPEEELLPYILYGGNHREVHLNENMENILSGDKYIGLQDNSISLVE